MFLTPAERIADHEARGWWRGESVDRLFQAVAARRGEALALVDPMNRESLDGRAPERLTWAALRDRVERVAGALLAAGLAKDDVVVAQLPNTVDAVTLLLAASRLGLILSPVVMQYRAHELGQILALTEPKALVTVPMFNGVDHRALAEAVAGPGVQVLMADALLAGDPAPVADAVAAAPTMGGEVLTICWTSGTESAPKGVPRDHNHWMLNAQVIVEAVGMQAGEVILNPFPLVNIASIGGLMLPWLWVEGVMVLHHPFDLKLFLAQIAAEQVSYTIAPPAVLTALLLQPGLLEATDISSLRAIGSGSAPLSPFLIRGWQEKGIEICNIFGSNEGCSLFSGAVDVPDPEQRARFFVHRGQAGIAADCVQTRLVDPASETEIEVPGVAGELRLKGGNIFSGYWRAPEINARAFDAEGWFRTGDLFEIAGEGELARFYRFVGRSKEIIVRGGVNISPAEVDDLLVGAPGVAEAATVGVPDAVLGERVAVAVVPRPGEAAPDLAALGAWLEGRGCAIFKRPERLVVLERLPRNAMNKVVRADLRAEVLAVLEG